MYTYIRKKEESNGGFISTLRNNLIHPSPAVQPLLDKITKFTEETDFEDPKLIGLAKNMRSKFTSYYKNRRAKAVKHTIKCSKLNRARKIFLLLLESGKFDILIYTNYILKFVEHPNEYLREITYSIFDMLSISDSIKKQWLRKLIINNGEIISYSPQIVKGILDDKFTLENYTIEKSNSVVDIESLKNLLSPTVLSEIDLVLIPQLYEVDDCSKIIGMEKLSTYYLEHKLYEKEIFEYIIRLLCRSENDFVVLSAIKALNLFIKENVDIKCLSSNVTPQSIKYKVRGSEKEIRLVKYKESEISELLEETLKKLQPSTQFTILKYKYIMKHLSEVFINSIIDSLVVDFNIHLLPYTTNKETLYLIYNNTSESGKIKILKSMKSITYFEDKDFLKAEKNERINLVKLELIEQHFTQKSELQILNQYLKVGSKEYRKSCEILSANNILLSNIECNKKNVDRYSLLVKDKEVLLDLLEQSKDIQYFKFLNTAMRISCIENGENQESIEYESDSSILEDLTLPIEFKRIPKEKMFKELTPLTDMLFCEVEYSIEKGKLIAVLQMKNQSNFILTGIELNIFTPLLNTFNMRPFKLSAKESKSIPIEFIIHNELSDIEIFIIFNYTYTKKGKSKNINITCNPLSINRKDIINPECNSIEDFNLKWRNLEWENNFSSQNLNIKKLQNIFTVEEFVQSGEYEVYKMYSGSGDYTLINILKTKYYNNIRIRSYSEEGVRNMANIIRSMD